MMILASRRYLPLIGVYLFAAVLYRFRYEPQFIRRDGSLKPQKTFSLNSFRRQRLYKIKHTELQIIRQFINLRRQAAFYQCLGHTTTSRSPECHAAHAVTLRGFVEDVTLKKHNTTHWIKSTQNMLKPWQPLTGC